MNHSCTFQNEQQRELGCTTELNGSLQHRVIWFRGAKHSSSIDMRIKGQLVFLNAITTVCAYKAQQWQCTWAGFQTSLKGTYSMWRDALAAAKIVTEGMGCTVLLKSPMMNSVLYVTMLCCCTQLGTTPALNRKQTVSAELPQTALVEWCENWPNYIPFCAWSQTKVTRLSVVGYDLQVLKRTCYVMGAGTVLLHQQL